MFDVRISFIIQSDAEGHAYLNRTLQLPFPPFVGLRVVVNADDAEGEEGEEITEVIWRPKEALFDCRRRDDKLGIPDYQSGNSLNAAVEYYASLGWTVDRVFHRPNRLLFVPAPE